MRNMTRNLTRALLLILPFGLSGNPALALDAADVPAGPPDDAVMAAPAEMAGMADWAAAAFTGGGKRHAAADGAQRPAGQASPPLLTPAGPPFSFVLGGKPSGELLKDWRRTAEADDLPDRWRHRAAWTDPNPASAWPPK